MWWCPVSLESELAGGGPLYRSLPGSLVRQPQEVVKYLCLFSDWTGRSSFFSVTRRLRCHLMHSTFSPLVFSFHPLLVWVVYVCCLWSDRLAQLVEGRRDIASVPPPSVDCIHALSSALTNAIYIIVSVCFYTSRTMFCAVLVYARYALSFFLVFSTAKRLSPSIHAYIVYCTQ